MMNADLSEGLVVERGAVVWRFRHAGSPPWRQSAHPRRKRAGALPPPAAWEIVPEIPQLAG